MNIASQVLLENLAAEGIEWTVSQGRFPNRIEPSIMVQLKVPKQGAVNIHEEHFPYRTKHTADWMLANALRKWAPESNALREYLLVRGNVPVRLCKDALESLPQRVPAGLESQGHSSASILALKAFAFMNSHDAKAFWGTLAKWLESEFSKAEKEGAAVLRRDLAFKLTHVVGLFAEMRKANRLSSLVDEHGHPFRDEQGRFLQDRTQVETFALEALLASQQAATENDWMYAWLHGVVEEVPDALSALSTEYLASRDHASVTW